MKVSRPDIQHVQLRIINEICRNDTYAETAKAQGTFNFAVKCLSSINEEVNAESSLLLTGYANSNENRKYIASLNAIRPLVELLWRAQSEDVLQKAVTCLWTLAVCDENRHEIREAGGIEVLCELLKSPYEGVLENTTIALGYLTRDDESKVKVRKCSGIKALLDVLMYPKESIQSKAAGALWNCASNADNKTVIRELGGIPQMLELLDSPNESVLENITGALWNLAVDSENKST